MSALDLSRVAGISFSTPSPAAEPETNPAGLTPAASPAGGPIRRGGDWPAAAPRSDPGRAAAPPSILIVDDNIRFAATVAAFMEMEGFRAEATHSAEEALLAAERREFDLAVVDINMPGIDGIEVCRRLGEMHPRIRVLLLTGRDSDDDPQRSAAAGAFRLLNKPMPLATLRDELLLALVA